MQSSTSLQLIRHRSSAIAADGRLGSLCSRTVHLIPCATQGSRYDNAGFSQPKQSSQRPLGRSPTPTPKPLQQEPAVLAVNTRALKEELMSIVRRMGIRAILPGSDEDKAVVDKLMEQLQRTDATYHLRSDSGSNAAGSGRDYGSYIDPRLFGAWELLYASNGTAVTRTGVAQFMISAGSQLPGVGISGIRQTLSLAADGGITTTNEAVFGFGPLGSWAIGIDGAWQNTGDGRSVKVMFDKFKVKPVGVLGLNLPEWLPQVLISLGSDSAPRGGADWFTTYLDDEVRIGRGKSGNTFLFRRLNATVVA